MFQIYRNLHHGLKFSIRERGRVIDRLTDFVAYNIRFRVGEHGRQRVLRERRKNVHAFIVAESYVPVVQVDLQRASVISYNPYLAGHFVCDSEPIHTCTAVAFSGGRCYKIC